MNNDKIELFSRLIMNRIKDGVLVNDCKRDFDIVDYYKITKLNLNQFFSIAKPYLSTDDLRKLRVFALKYGDEKRIRDCDLESKIINPKLVVNVEFDENGKYIPDSGRQITIDEKKNAIAYLKTNKIPVTITTYKLTIRRLINNEISFDDIKAKKSK